MTEFKVLTARQGRDGQADKAVLCASYAEGWAADDLNKDYRLVRVLRLECHWTARVVLNELEPDTEQDDGA